MSAVLLISIVTFKELVREKTLHGLLFVFLLISLFSLVLGQLSFAEQVRLSMDFGLAVMHFSLVGLALLLGSQLVHRELERKTVFTLLVKPIYRTQYLLGKFLGLSFLLFFTCFLCSLFLVFSMRYFGEFYWREILTAASGQWFESFFLVAVTLLLSQRLKPAATVFCGVALFLIGHWFETLQFLAEKNKEGALRFLYQFISFSFPNLENWNWKGMVIYGEFLSFADLTLAGLQALIWSCVYLCVATLIFERRDLVS